MYTALVISDESRDFLLSMINPIPLGFTVMCHHMTVNIGPGDPELLGKEFSVKLKSFAQNDKVMAFGVETECPSNNKIKHITLAVNRAAGGKPVMSNDLTDWKVLSCFETMPSLMGTVKECQ